MVPTLVLLLAETARHASPDTIAMEIARPMRRVSALQVTTAQEAPSHTTHPMLSMVTLLDWVMLRSIQPLLEPLKQDITHPLALRSRLSARKGTTMVTPPVGAVTCAELVTSVINSAPRRLVGPSARLDTTAHPSSPS